MTPEQKAAFITAQAACAMARIAGMQAENTICLSRGEALAYTKDAFTNIAYEYGINHKAVLALFYS